MTAAVGPRGWATSAVIRAAAQLAWDRGHVLRELHQPESERSYFPRRVRLGGPRSAEVGQHLGQVASWARELRAAAEKQGWRLETRTMRAGELGRQSVPVCAWLDTPEIALALLGRGASAQASCFAQCLLDAAGSPSATALALQRPHTVLAAAPNWPRLLAITDWVAAHPRPGVHVRQVPVGGVHTKLIAEHEGLLAQLLSARLPADAVDTSAPSFAGRFGFAEPERLVLLAARREVLGLPCVSGATAGESHAQVFWPLSALAALDPAAVGISEVLVTENKLSAETAPTCYGRLTVWGAGYGADTLLAALPWLREVRVRYWGDLDTHGLAILARVRSVLPRVQALLMEVDVLLAHREHWVVEAAPHRGPMPRELTSAEAELYELLRSNTLGDRVRLEQEYLPFDLVAGALAQ